MCKAKIIFVPITAQATVYGVQETFQQEFPEFSVTAVSWTTLILTDSASEINSQNLTGLKNHGIHVNLLHQSGWGH